MKEPKFTTVTLKQRKGMEPQGDMVNEYLTEDEIAANKEKWEEYVAKAKADGTYGQEYEMKIEIEHDPLLDNNKFTSNELPNHSVSFSIWDGNKKDR